MVADVGPPPGPRGPPYRRSPRYVTGTISAAGGLPRLVRMTTQVREGPSAELPIPSRVATMRHLVRSRLIEHPSLYFILARRRYPGPSPAGVDDATELVIEGYMRSANTFVVHAFQCAQRRPVRLAHHLHAPAQLLEAVRRGIPALALIREPEGTILSQVQWEPGVSMEAALATYARFYSCLMPVADRLVVGEFSEVTTDPAGVVARVNARYGTVFDLPSSTLNDRLRCFELMQERASLIPEWRHQVLRFESGQIGLADLEAARPTTTAPAAGRSSKEPDHPRDSWMPSDRRAAVGRELRRRYRSTELAGPRRLAEDAYAAFLGAVAAERRVTA